MNVSVAFESKPRHTTPWLSVEFPIDEEPRDLFSALTEIGWAEEMRYPRIPPLDGVQEAHIIPPTGSDLFGSWNKRERREHMRQVRRVLREQGFVDVPWHKLTWADLV